MEGESVGVLLREKHINSVLEATRVSERARCLKIDFDGVLTDVISPHAPKVGCEWGKG